MGKSTKPFSTTSFRSLDIASRTRARLMPERGQQFSSWNRDSLGLNPPSALDRLELVKLRIRDSRLFTTQILDDSGVDPTAAHVGPFQSFRCPARQVFIHPIQQGVIVCGVCCDGTRCRSGFSVARYRRVCCGKWHRSSCGGLVFCCSRRRRSRSLLKVVKATSVNLSDFAHVPYRRPHREAENGHSPVLTTSRPKPASFDLRYV